MELLKLTMTEATSFAVDRIKEEFGFNDKTAKEMLKNALTNNVVIEEILNQIGFMIDSEE